jgi:predicted nucleic acid-binding protein
VKLVVCDTGPVLHLTEANLLNLLELVGQLVVPPAVAAELEHLLEPGDAWPPLVQTGLSKESLELALGWESNGVLHRGEAEAIALALEIGAHWLLTDDAAARVFAESQGVEVHGSVGVVLWGAASAALDIGSAEQALQQLAGSSLWVSDRVLTAAADALKRICHEP